MGDNIEKVVYQTLLYNTVSLTTLYHQMDPKHSVILREQCIFFLRFIGEVPEIQLSYIQKYMLSCLNIHKNHFSYIHTVHKSQCKRCILFITQLLFHPSIAFVKQTLSEEVILSIQPMHNYMPGTMGCACQCYMD